MEVNYNDGRLPGGRRPRLYLARGGQVLKFTGENIPGHCAITMAQYEQNGKWSNTTYRIELAPGVRALEFLSPMHGTWGDDCPSWGAVVERLGLPIEAAQALVRAEYPSTAKRLDALEAFAAECEAADAQVETVIVSFGSPTNRQMEAGYWAAPKSAVTADGRTVTVRPHPEKGWGEAEVLEPAGARVISSKHSPGMHGGCWSVEVAVPVEAAQQA